MNFRKFGRIGWQVSELEYGMWGMGGQWGGKDDISAMKALHKAVETDVNFFDTAWVYGQGHSEKLLGQLIKECPDNKLIVTTKIPPKNSMWPAKSEYKLADTYPPDHIAEYTHKSLENLGLTCLDLTLFHVWDDSWADEISWQQSVYDLKDQGLIKAFGISLNRWEPENAIQAIKTGLIDAVEVVYNIFDQNPEDELFPVCHENGVAIIARVPFDEGTLTGTLTLDSKWPEGDWRNKYFTPSALKSSVAHAEKLRQDIPPGITMTEIALRFILSNPDVATVIPGMRRMENVVSNVAAAEKGKLDPEFMKKLRSHRWNRRPDPTVA